MSETRPIAPLLVRLALEGEAAEELLLADEVVPGGGGGGGEEVGGGEVAMEVAVVVGGRHQCIALILRSSMSRSSSEARTCRGDAGCEIWGVT